MKKLIAISLIFSLNLQSQEVPLLEMGDPAPFKGYLFTEEEQDKLQTELLQKDQLEIRAKLLEENMNLYKEDAKEWKFVAQENTERVIKMERYSFWQNALFFGLGVVATSALAIGLSKGVN